MAPIDDNGELIDRSPPKDDVFVDANEEANPIANARNVRNVQDNTTDRINNNTIQQTKKSCCWSILNLSTKPVFVLPMITSIAMTIGILVVCFTASKSSGMSLLLCILRIQYDKNP
ncbi:unnamed protein product [Rotaria sordida]|uniref:Uncharacterized protein n=1 Tax=Rotaria sordida TaxID=392033 RepID=A0A815SDR4_9BILA|nr:unnamed protein product [Rotaria sordida]CAF1488848.1 unnamed protein product [Rotaria sordida]